MRKAVLYEVNRYASAVGLAYFLSVHQCIFSFCYSTKYCICNILTRLHFILICICNAPHLKQWLLNVTYLVYTYNSVLPDLAMLLCVDTRQSGSKTTTKLPFVYNACSQWKSPLLQPHSKTV